MALSRCPKCGRAATGSECFACGHTWSTAAPANPFAKTTPQARAASGAAAANPFVSRSPPKPITDLHEVAAINPPSPTSKAAASKRPPSTPPAGNPFTQSTGPTRETALGDQVAPPTGVIEHFLRSRWGFLGLFGLSFFVVFTAGMLLAFAGRNAVLDQIDSSADEARAARKRLASTERTPTEDLMLGHANARLGAPRAAFTAYLRAARRGAVDDRALQYVLLALKSHPDVVDPALSVLAEWPNADVDDDLRDRLDAPWAIRTNALAALARRGRITTADRLAVARRDLTDDLVEGCEEIKSAVDVLATYSKEPDDLILLDRLGAEERGKCVPLLLQDAQSKIRKR